MIGSWFGCVFFFFKQKTAYELRISDWSSDVCSSDLVRIDIARRDSVHGHAKSGALLRQGLGESMNARLGGRVIHLPILARLAVDRSDIHDPAPAAIPHAGKAGLRHVEAAAQIDAAHFVTIFKAHTQESPVARNEIGRALV